MELRAKSAAGGMYAHLQSHKAVLFLGISSEPMLLALSDPITCVHPHCDERLDHRAPRHKHRPGVRPPTQPLPLEPLFPREPRVA
eukprot:scaffold221251_cov32-Tisochrysis_lutea.AAC.1